MGLLWYVLSWVHSGLGAVSDERNSCQSVGDLERVQLP